MEKHLASFLNDFRSGKLGRITVEWPPVKEEKA